MSDQKSQETDIPLTDIATIKSSFEQAELAVYDLRLHPLASAKLEDPADMEFQEALVHAEAKLISYVRDRLMTEWDLLGTDPELQFGCRTSCRRFAENQAEKTLTCSLKRGSNVNTSVVITGRSDE